MNAGSFTANENTTLHTRQAWYGKLSQLVVYLEKALEQFLWSAFVYYILIGRIII